MNKWFCYDCALKTSGGFPFEEKNIDGTSDRTCEKCGITRARGDMHYVVTSEACQCYTCLDRPEKGLDNPANNRMVLCVDCGNKRCPKATNHEFKCTRSNESNQIGSRYV